MSEQLSEQEAQKLFNEISSAVKDNDNVKLTALMGTEEKDENAPDPTKEEPEIPDPAVDTPEDDKDDGNGTDDPQVDEPADQPSDDDKDKDKPDDKDELSKLKEQLEKISKENHALKSQAGRVPYVQRRIKELDQKLEELSKKSTSPDDQPSTKLTPKILEKLKGIKEDDPELADAIAQVIGEATDTVAADRHAQEKDTLTFLREQAVAEYREAEVQRLVSMYPNAGEVFASPSWKEWKKEQTQTVLALAGSDNADDVAFAFEKYAKDMLAKHPELGEQVEAKDDKNDPAPNAEEQEKAKRIEAERKRKKANATDVSNPTAAGKVNMPDDPEALFNYFSDKIRKERLG